MLSNADAARFRRLRRAAIEREYSYLNPMQRQAVLATEGPLLLLAGAGSGKTTVLISRIANLIQYGRAADSDEVPSSVTMEDLLFLENYVNSPAKQDSSRAEALCRLDPAPPWSILAITFTNKAAGELKSRLEKLLGGAAPDVWAATFHAACVRILRREIDRLGFPNSFTIYDTDDSVRVLKDLLRSQGLDDKVYAPKMLLGHFGRHKDAMRSPEDALRESREAGDIRRTRIAELYAAYQKRLREAGAVDFDDIYLSHRPPAYGQRGGAQALPEQVPVCARRRVPGHEPHAVPACPAPFRRDGRSLRGRRRRPEHLPLPGRDDRKHPRLPGGIQKLPGSYGSSRTTARRKPSSRPPTASSPTTNAAAERSSGATRTRAGRFCSTPPQARPTRPGTSRERSFPAMPRGTAGAKTPSFTASTPNRTSSSARSPATTSPTASSGAHVFSTAPKSRTCSLTSASSPIPRTTCA
jgi:hypothetical protein